MGIGASDGADVLSYGLVAKFLLPVVGKDKGVLFDIPFKDNVRGLVHDNLVPLKAQPQVFLGFLAHCVVNENAVEGIRAALAFDELTLVQNPDGAAVAAGCAVLDLLGVFVP